MSYIRALIEARQAEREFTKAMERVAQALASDAEEEMKVAGVLDKDMRVAFDFDPVAVVQKEVK